MQDFQPLVQLADVCNTEWRENGHYVVDEARGCNLLMFVIPNGGPSPSLSPPSTKKCNLLMFVIPNGGKITELSNPQIRVQLADVCNTEWRERNTNDASRPVQCNLLMFVIPNGGESDGGGVQCVAGATC